MVQNSIFITAAFLLITVRRDSVMAKRWRRDSALPFNRATAQLVSSIDDYNNSDETEELTNAAVVNYGRSVGRRQHDPPILPDFGLGDIEHKRLDSQPRQHQQQYDLHNNKPAVYNNNNENYLDNRRRSGAHRKSAPHFLRTPPPLQAVDPLCNSESLQKIMLENMNEDVRESKRAIIQAAEALIGGSFNVICARTHFSYITTTRLFCLVVKQNAKCYAFLTDTSLAQSPPATAEQFAR